MKILEVATETLQIAVKAVVDAIKITTDATKVKVDNINVKQDDLSQKIDNVNTKVDPPFEANKLLPFQITGAIGTTNWASIYKVTGSGLLDLAIAIGSTGGAGIRVVVDGVTFVETPPQTQYTSGVSPSGEYSGGGGVPVTLMYGTRSSTVGTPTGTYVPGATTASAGMLWISRPIKFNNSLEVFITTGSSAEYRIQGGIFV